MEVVVQGGMGVVVLGRVVVEILVQMEISEIGTPRSVISRRKPDKEVDQHRLQEKGRRRSMFSGLSHREWSTRTGSFGLQAVAGCVHSLPELD